ALTEPSSKLPVSVPTGYFSLAKAEELTISAIRQDALQKIRSFSGVCRKSVVLPCRHIVFAIRWRRTDEITGTKSSLVKDLLGHRSVSTTMEYVELQMDIVGKTLEAELSLHTDITDERNLHPLTQA
ncbi:hypothetical protein UA70_28920, partial [Raoultella planticola]